MVIYYKREILDGINVGRCEREEHGPVIQILESRERRIANWRNQMELHKVLGFSWRQSLPEIFSQNVSSSVRGTYHPCSHLNRNPHIFMCAQSYNRSFFCVQKDIQALLGQASSWIIIESFKNGFIYLLNVFTFGPCLKNPQLCKLVCSLNPWARVFK